jgi:hypothetical protein
VDQFSGSGHRRFWRTGSGSATSRYEVDVVTARKAKGGSMPTSPAKAAPTKSVKRKPRAAKSAPADP